MGFLRAVSFQRFRSTTIHDLLIDAVTDPEGMIKIQQLQITGRLVFVQQIPEELLIRESPFDHWKTDHGSYDLINPFCVISSPAHRGKLNIQKI